MELNHKRFVSNFRENRSNTSSLFSNYTISFENISVYAVIPLDAGMAPTFSVISMVKDFKFVGVQAKTDSFLIFQRFIKYEIYLK